MAASRMKHMAASFWRYRKVSVRHWLKPPYFDREFNEHIRTGVANVSGFHTYGSTKGLKKTQLQVI